MAVADAEIAAHRDAAESALRQVREDLTALADEWKRESPIEGREPWYARELRAVLARVGVADTQPEGAGGVVLPAGITPGGMQVCPDCGRWGLNPAGLCTNDFHTPTSGVKVLTAPDDMCPNCVTPWKCNGPHTLMAGSKVDAAPDADPSRYLLSEDCPVCRGRDVQCATCRLAPTPDAAPESGEGR
jgi:hypothetical protein